MLHATLGSVEDKQSRLVALRRRGLGDQFWRQFEAKISGSHGGSVNLGGGA
jgi:hypothetical protein